MDLLDDFRQDGRHQKDSSREGALENGERHAPTVLLGGVSASVNSCMKSPAKDGKRAQRLAARKAADVARGVLRYFEQERPNDKRPRKAIEAIRQWASGTRQLGMAEIRKLSLDAHTAARAAGSDAARYSARAAGQAVATAHVITHAPGASWYAEKIRMTLQDARKPFVVSGMLTKYPVPAAWHYVALPKKISERLARGRTTKKKGWGYVMVTATLGKTSWVTGLWPKAKDGVYLLVVNKEVREKEKAYAGNKVRVTITPS